MAHDVKKGTALLPIAALVVAMAMFLSSCDAAGNYIFVIHAAWMQILHVLSSFCI